MKKMVMGLFIMVWSAAALITQAQVPGLISYQGRVTDEGKAYSGTGYFKFALVNDAGNQAYWSNDGSGYWPLTEPDSAVPIEVEHGLFSLYLGDSSMTNMTEDLASVVFEHAAVHLRVWFSDDDTTFEQLVPDTPIGSVGYAMMAARVADNAITYQQLAHGSVIAAKIADGAVSGQKLAADSITAEKIQNATITSNKLDWATMPAIPAMLGYAESGLFSTSPVASGDNAIALGNQAVASAMSATVGGGDQNQATAEYATVGGGRENEATSGRATVAGGLQNKATGFSSSIGGGAGNRSANDYTTVAGGQSNTATNNFAAVGGGEQNTASGVGAFVGGGQNNTASGANAVVAGGIGNAAGTDSFVGGGRGNQATAEYAVIGGGLNNEANIMRGATVAGGENNKATGQYATVGGGFNNDADNWYATIPGGRDNQAGPYAFSAGRRAKALMDGSFVWGDSTDADVLALVNDSVTFRASGGYRLFTDSAMMQGAVLLPNETAWSSISDRDAKENFAEINTAEILEKLADLPLTAWNYKADPGQRRYIGPVAQDFHAAFGLSNDTSINTLDADGVAFAAIQGLNAKLEEDVSLLREENADLKTRLERLESVVFGLSGN